MHHPRDRIIHTTAFVTPVVEHWLEQEIAQWVHPMNDRSNDPSHHERTLLPWSYISLQDHSDSKRKSAAATTWTTIFGNSKGSFIRTIQHTGEHIRQPLLHQSWSTGLNKK